MGTDTSPAAMMNGLRRRMWSLAAPSATDPAMPPTVIVPATRPAMVSLMPWGLRISLSHVVMPR